MKYVRDIELDCNLHWHRILMWTTMDHLLLHTGLVSSLKPLVVAFLCHGLFDRLSSHLDNINIYHFSVCFFFALLAYEYDPSGKHTVRVFHFLPLENTFYLMFTFTTKQHVFLIILQGDINTWFWFIRAPRLRTSISLSAIKFISVLINTPTNAVLTLYRFVLPIFGAFRLKLARSTSCIESITLARSQIAWKKRIKVKNMAEPGSKLPFIAGISKIPKILL